MAGKYLSLPLILRYIYCLVFQGASSTINHYQSMGVSTMTPVEYILRENKNCNMWWTCTGTTVSLILSI